MNFHQQIKNLKNHHQFRQIPNLLHQGRFVEINGQYCLNLSGNDYLGLSYKKELQQEFLEQYRGDIPLFSSTSSRLLTGNFVQYQQLEMLMADLFQQESCLLFNSGYHANIGILPAITDKNSLIIADKLVHASLIDGIRLAGCDFLRYRHNDYQHLATLLTDNASLYQRIIIVTESIFSMDGDFTDLTALIQLKKQYNNILLYVDEAHAFGLYGKKGLGLAEELNCISDIDFLVGTFGKAAASIGAYLISSRLIRDLLINKMRPLIFSTTIPPFNIAVDALYYPEITSSLPTAPTFTNYEPFFTAIPH
ncbi:aminotransferase class I/II-fold pyridoxal phosphate-dependent enzyme [Pelistega indica]|uniref:aminotransferase class I/II-fold pyridoxal phosphate-dependent enzyme n=1 Tax=Pelistega indica TaxID=1414851 RepID=UPI00040069D5|nr:8-amino-7-oxononanoate synthase [Pelistega indica]